MTTITLHNAAFAELAAPLVELGLLSLTDAHVADRLGALVGEDDAAVLLGVALAVAAPAAGHTGVALEQDLVRLQQALREPTARQDTELATRALQLLPPQPDVFARMVLASRLVGDDPATLRPLVMTQGLLQTHRMASYEARLAAALRKRAIALPLAAGQVAALGDALRRIGGGQTRNPAQEQAVVVAAASALSVICGGPGTGKTTTVRKLLLALRAALGEPNLRVALAAPTGKAAARLRESLLAPPSAGQLDGLDEGERAWLATLPTSTLHRLLGTQARTPSRFRHTATDPLPYALIVVDEASMIDVALMCKLVEATPLDARLVLLGDRNQLASVQAGSVLADITQPPAERVGVDGALQALLTAALGPTFASAPLAARPDPLAASMIRFHQAFRFQTPTLGDVIYAVAAASEWPEGSDEERRAIDDVVASVQRPDPSVLRLLPHGEAAKTISPQLIEAAAAVFVAAVAPVLVSGHPATRADEATALRAIDAVRVLAAHREGRFGVSGLNAQLSEAVQARLKLTAAESRQRWWPGRLVLVTENDHESGLFNGDIGVVLRGGERANVLFAGADGPWRVPAASLPAHETAFAMTIHKSQGSQFDHVYVVLPREDSRLLSRELLYTAMSRARGRLTLCGDPALLRAALLRRVQRATALGSRLWTEEPEVPPRQAPP